MKDGIAIGDLVVLNSGGPKMTVVAAERGTVQCAWTTAAGRLQSAWFPVECVFRVDGSGGIGVA